MTIDVESAAAACGGRACAAELERALDAFLEAAGAAKTAATFFVLGADAQCIAPALRRCAAAGHEIASHGMTHFRVCAERLSRFEAEAAASRRMLEDIAQRPCLGFRAPWFSLGLELPRAFEVLAEAGYKYDASLRLPLEAVARAAGNFNLPLREVPVPLLKFAGLAVGAVSGLALRCLPQPAAERMVRACEKRRVRAVFYLHPYEWLRTETAAAGSVLSAARRRLLLGRTLPALGRMASRFKLNSIANIIAGTAEKCAE